MNVEEKQLIISFSLPYRYNTRRRTRDEIAAKKVFLDEQNENWQKMGKTAWCDKHFLIV